MARTEYEIYLRTDELLALQKAPAALTTHDEMQFQIVHQVAELWMKLVQFELARVVDLMAEDQPALAAANLRRVACIQRLLIAQLDLLDTMSSKEYMTIRTGLGRGSGQESPGFKALLRLPGETVWPAMAAFLGQRGVTLRQIYEEPAEHHDLYTLAEGLVDYDQLLQTWRYRHLILVYRQIGAGTPSLKGKPSELLAQGMKQKFFPALWEVRDAVFEDWTKNMLAHGHDTGYHG
jgi:tryptophan 2,3-dioxygenase